MVSEAPSLAPRLEVVGGRHSRTEPWGRGVIPKGWSILGTCSGALASLPVLAAALQSCLSFLWGCLMRGELQWRGEPSHAPKSALGNAAPCPCASAPPSAEQKLLCCAVLNCCGSTRCAPSCKSLLPEDSAHNLLWLMLEAAPEKSIHLTRPRVHQHQQQRCTCEAI